MIRRTVSLGKMRCLRESDTMHRISSGENRTVSRLSAGLAGRRLAVSGFIVGASVRHFCESVNQKKRPARRFFKKAHKHWAKMAQKRCPRRQGGWPTGAGMPGQRYRLKLIAYRRPASVSASGTTSKVRHPFFPMIRFLVVPGVGLTFS